MSNRGDLDAGDDFSDIYKEYTGPLGSNVTKTTQVKRSHSGLDEDAEARDPNAVPTDFTSREAKVWEAKSKATERNWKKRKEEELICKICGESGHFTQGCPSTLGGNRKSLDFIERVPARDPHVKALFTQDRVRKIEEDIGCKLKIEEKFIIVSGKDRLILKKGVDAVHQIKEDAAGKEPDPKGYSTSPVTNSRSFGHRSPAVSRIGRNDYQISNRSTHSVAYCPNRYNRQDKVAENTIEELSKMSSGSPYARGEAHNNDGGKRRSSNSKSPAHSSYGVTSFSLYEGHAQGRGSFRSDGYGDTVESKMQLLQNFECPRTLEDLELHYKKEAMELAKIRDKEEDDEISRHRQVVREMRESYMEKVAILKVAHSNMWMELFHLESERNQKMMKAISSSEFKGFEQLTYSEYDNSSGNFHHSAASIHSRIKYPDNYPSRLQNSYHDFQHHRRGDNGKPFNRY